MIKDWNAYNLRMDFSNVEVPTGRPSDLDFFWVFPEWLDEDMGGYIILGEIKNESGHFTDEQRHLYEGIIDNNKRGGTALYITHNKMWQDGDKTVDVSSCQVREYYFRGKWRQPKSYTTVNEMIHKVLAFESTHLEM